MCQNLSCYVMYKDGLDTIIKIEVSKYFDDMYFQKISTKLCTQYLFLNNERSNLDFVMKVKSNILLYVSCWPI